MLIPGYQIEQLIAEGGTSSVYLAVQKSLGRRVAIKVLRKFDSSQQAERFLHEARIIASLEHRNVITIYDVGSVGERFYIAMEYLEGGSLADRIEHGIQPAVALDLLEGIASCLEFVHRRDIVHRDIKPGNILFHADGTAKLTDFGIAKQLDADQELTLEGSAFGSPYYLSPEQAEGRTLNGRSDIYSLGIVFYQMLTGRRPYAESSHIETIVAHLSKPIPVLPEGLSQYQGLLEEMIAKSPENRIASARELMDLIGKVRLQRPKRSLGFAPSGGNDDSVPPQIAQDNGIMGRLLGTSLLTRVSAAALVLVAGFGLVWWPGDGVRNQLAVPLAKRNPVVELRHDAGGGVFEQQIASSGPVKERESVVPVSEPTPVVELDELRPAPATPLAETVVVAVPEQADNGSTSDSGGESARQLEASVEMAEEKPDHPAVAALEAVSRDAEPVRIDDLMLAGDRAFKANRLTKPAGDNAYESYLKVAEMDPGNSGAEAGIDRIADRYAALANGAFGEKDYRLARVYVGRGLRVRGQHAGLRSIRDRVIESERAAMPPVSEQPLAPVSPPQSARVVSRTFEGTSITSSGPAGTGNIAKDFKRVWGSVFD